MAEKVLARLTAPGPKRMLALDGGGIRGAIALGFLEKIEKILRDRHGNPNLLLCDYFDLIGGTSTGAIIATMLATGRSVSELIELYNNLGGKIFGDKYSVLQIGAKLKASYDDAPLQAELKNIFGDIHLGDDAIRTGVCVTAKRADTFSTWAMINHPKAKYFEPARPGEIGNKDYLLREVVRASTAAPTYFLPQRINIGNRQATFIDGGISMANNPALQLFLVATLKGFPFHWPIGADKLMLVSIGTGTFTKVVDAEKIAGNNMLEWAATIPDMFMEDATFQNQLLLQYLSESPTAIEIDSEVGDLKGDVLTGKPALHYLRYQAYLEQPDTLPDGAQEDKPHLPFDDETIVKMRQMDKAEMVGQMMQVGRIYAQKKVDAGHFPTVFDLVKTTV
ncbi:MAG: patatin-like phospholipase family protein [Saprospirales bacterium]|nr:patatin-like phospholipase family protein [Saprospirales bacterium]MBK8922707.1 patatin-like phospholipase family protein [Saprospirales bacterium]